MDPMVETTQETTQVTNLETIQETEITEDGSFLESYKAELFEDIMNIVVKPLVETLKDDGFTRTMFITILKDIMEVIERSALRGLEQKEFLFYALKKVLSTINGRFIRPEIRTSCIEMIEDGSLDNMVELIIQASRGELNLNVVMDNVSTNCIFSIFKNLKSCFRKT